MLEIKNAHKTFFTDLGEAREIFKGLNFKAENGDFVTIIGSNGAGKSTLLNLVNGSIIPDEGTIMLNSDTEITKIDRHKRAQWISQVYQNPSQGTAPSMTVLENLSMAKNKGKKFDLTFGLDTKNIDFYKEQLATLGLGLENHLQTKVGMLSGGQRQCLSLIMSTLNHPDILLLDEHTAALDPQTSKIIMEKTEEIIRNNKNHHLGENINFLRILTKNKDFEHFFIAYQELNNDVQNYFSMADENNFRKFLEQHKGAKIADEYRILSEKIQIERFAPFYNDEEIEGLLETIITLYSEIIK